MKTFLGIFLATIVGCTAFSQQLPANGVRLYYLGGQSNMEGCGYNVELPDHLTKTFENVWIFQGNPARDAALDGGLGKWTQLKPGHGAYFHYKNGENEYSERFGIELSFAYRLQQLYPGEKIALIKYAQGATSLDSVASEAGCWDPDYHGVNGINQYDHLLTTMREANKIKDIDGDGVDDILVPQGIIWMQGESDARIDKGAAKRYYNHLVRLMDLIRAALHVDDLPVVIGMITDSGQADDGKVWEYCEMVQDAQERFAREDGNATIVRSTENYAYSDPWHYDSDGFIDLGKAFADAIHTFAK
jgi:hypothetical protein